MKTILLCAGFALSALAQVEHKEIHVAIAGPGGASPVYFREAGAEKGLPYAAETANETTQTLADGNRIVHKSASKVWRDSEGRTRHETEVKMIGPWAPASEGRQLVTIFDPVAGFHYSLNPADKTAVKMALPRFDHAKMAGGETIVEDVRAFNVPAPPPPPPPPPPADVFMGGGPVMLHHSMGTLEHASMNAKTEDLGQKTIEGLICTGTRTVGTTPAGAMGNERPIEAVTETWISTELKIEVLRKHSDPLSGETVYKLTNLRRGEQAKSLFEVPADYKIEEPAMDNIEVFTRDGKTNVKREVKIIHKD